MAPIPNPRLLFNSIPQGHPIPGETTVLDTSEMIDLENVSLNGGYLIKMVLISPEPWLRERLRDPTIASYATPMARGKSITGNCLAKVLRSEDPNFKPGDYVTGIGAWQLYTVHPWEGWTPAKPGQWPKYTFDVDAAGKAGMRKIIKHAQISLSTYLGALGTPGQTAYIGMMEYGDMKPGETIFVSTGAGAVGLAVCQLAKVHGLRVIASTGSDDKVKYLRDEIGVDHPFNYKTTSVASVLKEHGPIDIYWDNVGGETLETSIEYANFRGRIICCGTIGEYNNEARYGVKNISWFFKKSLHMYGFLLGALMPKYIQRFQEEMPKLILEGKMKSKEHLVYGFENVEQAWLELLTSGGGHLGKTVVVVDEEEMNT